MALPPLWGKSQTKPGTHLLEALIMLGIQKGKQWQNWLSPNNHNWKGQDQFHVKCFLASNCHQVTCWDDHFIEKNLRPSPHSPIESPTLCYSYSLLLGILAPPANTEHSCTCLSPHSHLPWTLKPLLLGSGKDQAKKSPKNPILISALQETPAQTAPRALTGSSSPPTTRASKRCFWTYSESQEPHAKQGGLGAPNGI